MSSSGVPVCVPGIVVERAGDEIFAFNPEDEMMHALNQSAAAIFSACDGERSVGEIVKRLADDSLSAEMIELGLAELSDAGLIVIGRGAVDMPSRREILKKLGVGAAAVAMIPVVESIVAPAAAAASSTPTPTPTPTPSPTPTPTPTPTGCDHSDWEKSSYTAGAIDCAAGTAEVCNTGDGPGTCPVMYAVLYSATGNPKFGEVLKTGHIAALGRGCGTVDFSRQKEDKGAGNYMVKFYQHPGHPGTGVLFTNQCTVS